jgi:type II secretory pathway pseudopilin PulG
MENEMKPPKQRSMLLIVVLLLVLAAAAGYIGWRLGQDNNNQPKNTVTNNSASDALNNAITDSDVKSRISYTLPDGWNENTCPAKADTVYVTPAGSSLDCAADPSAPIKIYMDPQNTTDCQQLANPQNVRKHVCSSLFIDGHKGLKASTEYLKSSSSASGMTISAYYISANKGVAKVEYVYTSSNDYQSGFERLATSVKVKN